MKTVFIILGVLAIFSFVECNTNNEHSKEAANALELKVKQLHDSYMSHLKMADTLVLFEFIEQNYISENTELITPKGEIITGADVMAWFRTVMGTSLIHYNVNVNYYDDSFKTSGNLVVHRYSYKLVMRPKKSGNTIKEIGHGIKVYEKTKKGKWKLLYDVWSAEPNKQLH